MSITPSVVRGNKGMVGCADFAREYLSEKLDLSRFVVKTEKDFLDVLENETAKFIQETTLNHLMTCELNRSLFIWGCTGMNSRGPL